MQTNRKKGYRDERIKEEKRKMDNKCLRNKKHEVKNNGNKILIKEERQYPQKTKYRIKKIIMK